MSKPPKLDGPLQRGAVKVADLALKRGTSSALRPKPVRSGVKRLKQPWKPGDPK